MSRVFVIAEAGVNHNGSIKTAKKLIDVAVNAGADAVKFQTFKAENLVTETAPLAKYQRKNCADVASQFALLKGLELSADGHRGLFSYCRKKKIEFLSTPFDEASVDFLDNLGVKVFKISSGDITNKPLICKIAKKAKPIIISTGMSTLAEIERSIDWVYKTWGSINTRKSLTLLHCISDYPAEPKNINLKAMDTMRLAFHLPVGFSDHTPGIEVSLAAVALGARVIEKHFTLNKNLKGPDHRVSLSPAELKTMVGAIRNIEAALGNGVKKPTPCEIITKRVARRSIVASTPIEKGEIFTEKNIITKRPEQGLSAIYWDKVIGRVARKDFPKDAPIEL